jgi:hypothetical protein
VRPREGAARKGSTRRKMKLKAIFGFSWIRAGFIVACELF